jgi:hypothetical protein
MSSSSCENNPQEITKFWKVEFEEMYNEIINIEKKKMIKK